MALPAGTDVEYLGAGSSGGVSLGRSDDKISFFAATPIVKPTVVAPATTATTTTNEAAIVALEAALVNLGLIATS